MFAPWRTRRLSASRRGPALWLLLALLLTLVGGACQSPLLSAVAQSGELLTPNGDGTNDRLAFTYVLGQPARVDLVVTAPDGTEHWLRRAEPRAIGEYAFRFDGAVAPPGYPDDRRVLPAGDYRWSVVATAAGGAEARGGGAFAVADPDTRAPEVDNLVMLPTRLSPNADGNDDEAVITFGLTKDATVEIYALGPDGERHVLEPPTAKKAALQSHRWNGQVNGRLLADGDYQVHIEATDAAGNRTDRFVAGKIDNGGRARLVITQARFFPISVPRGGFLDVEIVVRNIGEVPLRTIGPPPGTPYTTQMTFNSFRDSPDPNAPPQFFERAGVWRVGVDWENSGRPFPIRWGLTPALTALPVGAEAVITGRIQLLIDQTPNQVFWASVVQEGIGFPGGRVGQTRITISY